MNYVIHPHKTSKYLLNLSSAFGAPKARFYLSVGFDIAAPEQLDAALRRHPIEATIKSADPHPDGRKLRYECELATPSGTRVCVRTIWIEEREGKTTRLVTAYPFL